MKLPKERLHNFVAATARRWGFESRITLYNHTGEDAVVDLRVRDADGLPLATASAIGTLGHGASLFYDAADLCTIARLPPPRDADYLFDFALVPSRFTDATGPVDVERDTVYAYITAQDHYIEHYDPETLFSSGVLYQTIPINDPLLSPRSSFLMQAPKVFLSQERNTVVQVLHHSPDPDYSDEGLMLCGLRNARGERFLQWEQRIPAHGMRYLDVKEVLARHGLAWQDVIGRHGFLYLEAFGERHSFIPLTININEVRRTFDMEHSLPPVYYGSQVIGPRRGAILRAWAASFVRRPVAPSAPNR
jgi:hypothetical protein